MDTRYKRTDNYKLRRDNDTGGNWRRSPSNIKVVKGDGKQESASPTYSKDTCKQAIIMHYKHFQKQDSSL